MSNPNYFDALKVSLEEAVAYKNGDKRRCRVSVREIPVPEYAASDVFAVRKTLNLSQKALAAVLGVSIRTVEAWEAGRNAPSGSARHLLYLIDKDNSLVNHLIMK